MGKMRLILASLLCLGAILANFLPARAARGAPGSMEFGYGARLETDGPYFQDALDMAADLPLDWLGVTLRWSQYAPASAAWERLDSILQFCDRSGTSVLLSLTEPPADARAGDGPDIGKTAAFVLELAARYPGLGAIELFPGANTARGWGGRPDPRAYTKLFAAVQSGLQASGSNVLLVAGGLQPLTSNHPAGDIDDLDFLRELYAANPALALPVIGLVLQPAGDPLAAPDGVDRGILRHYEEVRQVMVDAGRAKDLIWVTSILPPDGTISSSDPNKPGSFNQTNWLYQAYGQMKSQLYIGVAFYRSLNPSAKNPRDSALILNNQQYHPFYGILRELIAQNSPGWAPPRHGRPKSEALQKRP